jgi:PKD repeat protein
MTTKAEGIWGCKVLSGKAGVSDGIANVQINIQIDEGPSAGQRGTYEDQVTTKSAKYVGWSCTAVGWKGVSLSTLEADIEEWIKKTGGRTTVEIKHIEIKKGKKYDKWVTDGCNGPGPVWDKVAGLGRGAAKPLAPLGGEALADADAAMRDVMGTPPQDGPVDGDDIPFISCSTVSLGEIAKVLK